MAAVFAPARRGRAHRWPASTATSSIANVNSRQPGRDRRRHRGGRARRSPPSTRAGYQAVPLPVSHAFHTAIVAPASEPLRRDAASGCDLAAARDPDRRQRRPASFYPMGPGVVDRRCSTCSAARSPRPVQFVKGLRDAVRRRARACSSRSARSGRCRLRRRRARRRPDVVVAVHQPPEARRRRGLQPGAVRPLRGRPRRRQRAAAAAHDRADARRRPARDRRRRRADREPRRGAGPRSAGGDTLPGARAAVRRVPRARPRAPAAAAAADAAPREPVVITGAGLGLPGDRARLRRRQRRPASCAASSSSTSIPHALRAGDRSTSTSRGWSRARTASAASRRSTSAADVIKLAGAGRRARPRARSSASPPSGSPRSTSTTQLAIGAGLDALRDAGHPARAALQDDHHGHARCPTAGRCPRRCATTPASSSPRPSPGSTRFADELDALPRATAPAASSSRPARSLRGRGSTSRRTATALADELDRRIHELRSRARGRALRLRPALPVPRARRWATRSSPSYIGARGPEHPGQRGLRQHHPGRRAGRGLDPRRPLPARGRSSPRDDVTSDHLLEWIGAGFLASGAAATDEVVEEAAAPVRPPPPRDDPRHGRRGARGRERRARRASAASARSARCSARSPPTAPSTAPGSTSTTSAR